MTQAEAAAISAHAQRRRFPFTEIVAGSALMLTAREGLGARRYSVSGAAVKQMPIANGRRNSVAALSF